MVKNEHTARLNPLVTKLPLFRSVQFMAKSTGRLNLKLTLL